MRAGRFDPEFVEKRRLKLEAFLAHCVAHPLLCCCVQLAAFCVWPEQLTALVRLNAPTEYVPAGDSWGRDGADPLKSALPDVVAFEAQARKLREALKSAQRRALDTSLEQVCARARMCQRVRACVCACVCVRSHVRRRTRARARGCARPPGRPACASSPTAPLAPCRAGRTHARAQMELAQAWSSFGHSDFNYGLRPSLSRLSDSMGALSALTRTQAESDSRSVLAALRMYIDLAEAISEQCRRRDASAKALEALAAELRAAQAAAARASGSRGASPAADKKAADLDERLSELTKRHAAAAARLSLHSRTLAAELGRFTAHKDADLGRALVQLVGEQALSADRVAAQWRALMPGARAPAGCRAREACRACSARARGGGGWGAPASRCLTPRGARTALWPRRAAPLAARAGVDARPQQHANGTAAHTSADAHAHSQLPARAAEPPYVSTPTPAPHPEPRTPNPSVGSAGLAAAGGGSAEDFSSGFIAHLSAASMAQRQGTPAGR